ncbi:MAG: DedA family protein [Coriobacteriia bacterium]
MTWLSQVLDWILAGLGAYGYVIVLVCAIIENVFILGGFLPGDLIVAAAAFTSTTPQGEHLSPLVLFGLAILGAFIGANISFLFGMRAGRAFIERVAARFGGGDVMDASEAYFKRHGPASLVFARFVAVVKSTAPTLAGIHRMKLLVFEAYTLAGATIYVAALVGIGLFLGRNFDAGIKYLGGFSWVVFALFGCLVIVGWRIKKRRDRALVEELDAEYDAEHAEELGEGHAENPEE